MELKNLIFEFFRDYGKSILISLIVLIAGLFGLKKLSKILMLVLRKSSLSTNISGLLNYIIKFLVYYLIIFFILDQFGVNAWNVIAPLGASIVALSVIFKDGISNFISGVFIFMNQTFKPGDYIELSSVKGTVVQIKYFYTIIYTDDDKSAIVPNSKMASEIIYKKAADSISKLKLIIKITNKNSSENLSSEELENIKKILEKFLILHSKHILESPSPNFSISKKSSEINISVWSWSSNFGSILLSFDNFIKNKLKDFNVDLSSDYKL